jgi:hypothetical protein
MAGRNQGDSPAKFFRGVPVNAPCMSLNWLTREGNLCARRSPVRCILFAPSQGRGRRRERFCLLQDRSHLHVHQFFDARAREIPLGRLLCLAPCCRPAKLEEESQSGPPGRRSKPRYPSGFPHGSSFRFTCECSKRFLPPRVVLRECEAARHLQIPRASESGGFAPPSSIQSTLPNATPPGYRASCIRGCLDPVRR